MRRKNRDRMHQYSRKFSGSHADRRKFLVKRRAKKTVDGDDTDAAAANNPAEDINALPSIGEIRPRSDAPLRNRKSGKKSAIESAVEDAVDKTL